VINFTEPVEGEKIAVFDIEGYGKIKIKLFPEQCPKGVENFEYLINEGYYDGVTFHRVIKDFMIQGGDPTGTGSGGESKWGKGFEQEINSSLRHFAGALSYATASDKLNKSQFFIVTGLTDIDDSYFNSLQGTYPDSVKELYSEKGGYPFLDGDYEVFGQVFEGLDICFEIAETETDSSDKPKKDVVISSAVIEEYKPE
jgi:cyclophilin family peptidyl-prolyl cis-trans isomerase